MLPFSSQDKGDFPGVPTSDLLRKNATILQDDDENLIQPLLYLTIDDLNDAAVLQQCVDQGDAGQPDLSVLALQQ